MVLPDPYDAYPKVAVGGGLGEGLQWAGGTPASYRRPAFSLMEERLVFVTGIASSDA